MNKQWMSIGLIVIAALTAGFFNTFQSDEKSAQTVSAQQGKEMVNNGALLVDARSPQEFARGHIEGAINIPYDQVSRRISEFGENKDKPIVFYCQKGPRAGKATETLRALGWPNAVNGGGIGDW